MSVPKKIKRNRKSRLQQESILIFKYWSQGKSTRFISHQLNLRGIECVHTTVIRFIDTTFNL